jgi:hypothetical protein
LRQYIEAVLIRWGFKTASSLDQEAAAMSCSETNYCKKEKMSICSAEDSKQQEKCSFFEKSSYEYRCMYFIFDEYCDCLAAQIQTK